MKNILLLIVLIVRCVSTYGQTFNTINYLVPVNVADKIQGYIDSNRSDKLVYGLFKSEKDTVSLLISSYDDSQKELSYLIHNTNRYMTLGHEKVPLIFQSDLEFSDSLHIVRNKGKGNEFIHNVAMMISGYLIVYRESLFHATIVRAGYFQY